MPMPVRLLSVISGESEENRTPALRIKSALLLPTKLPIRSGGTSEVRTRTLCRDRAAL